MMSSTTPAAIAPEVLWAQRTDEIFLTLNVSDIVDPQITLTKDQLKFEAANKQGKKYAVTLDFHAEVDPEASRKNITGRSIVFVLYKAAKEQPYWPRLLKSSAGKPHFLKTDFSRWKDEDEEDEEEEAAPAGPGGPGGPGGFDMSQFSGMGGMGGAGGMGGLESMMAGMGGAGGMGGMADLQSMMGGMGGAGGMDFSKFAGAAGDEEDSDDDLPDLEDAPPAVAN
ncbi:hypothetical protein HDU98_006114 [Podochytrium sp. JEL0797]|nr:hypothetical protein HDU98_006114 [Podochytrium sp. JEL0797]